MNRLRFLLLVLSWCLVGSRGGAAIGQIVGNLFLAVTNEQGEWLAGAVVKVSGQMETTTDLQGLARFPPIPGGQYTIVVTMSDCERWEGNVAVRNGRSTTIEIVLRCGGDPAIRISGVDPAENLTPGTVHEEFTREVEVKSAGFEAEYAGALATQDSGSWKLSIVEPGRAPDQWDRGDGELDLGALQIVPKDRMWVAHGTRQGSAQRAHLSLVIKNPDFRVGAQVTREGAYMDTDLGSDTTGGYAAYHRETATGSSIHVMQCNLDGKNRIRIGGELVLPRPSGSPFNLAPQVADIETTDEAAVTFTGCDTASGPCRRQYVYYLDGPQRDWQRLRELMLELAAPWEWYPGGAALEAEPDGSLHLLATAAVRDTGEAATFHYRFDTARRLDASVNVFPDQPFAYGGSDSLLVGAGSATVLARVGNLETGEWEDLVAPIANGRAGEATRVGTPGSGFSPRAGFVRVTADAQAPPPSLGFILPNAAEKRAGAATLTEAGLYHQQLEVRRHCDPDATTLCLGGGRFQVEATHVTGGGVGAGSGYLLSNDTGYFTFFDPANVELLVKVIDGCGLNGRFWVFAGGLTDVETVVTVTDMSTGEMAIIRNSRGTPFAPYQNTAAFPCGEATTAGAEGAAFVGADAERAALEAEAAAVDALEPAALFAAADVAVPAAPSTAPCQGDTTHVCLKGGRFEVSARWRTRNGAAGDGQAESLSPAGGGLPDTGLFWFFTPSNVEMIVKVLDGCGLNDRFWVFATGLTDVEVTITLRDTMTGAVRTYVNPLGNAFRPVQDTRAFATCP